MENPSQLPAIDYSKLPIAPWKNPSVWWWLSQRPDWWEIIYRNRQEKGYTNLSIVTGPLGGGKSSAALRWAERWDEAFSIDKVAFTPSEFTKSYVRAGSGSIVVWDEAELGLGHREFMSAMNRATTGFIESSRYLEVSVFFTLPLMGLMDSAAIRVSQFLIRMLNRGYARIHEIKPNQTGRNPPLWLPIIGDTRVAQPTGRMWEAYMSKRHLFHQRFFPVEKFEEAEQRLIEDSDGKQGWEKILANPSDFRDQYGRISAKIIVSRLHVSHSTAYTYKAIAEDHLTNPKNTQDGPK